MRVTPFVTISTATLLVAVLVVQPALAAGDADADGLSDSVEATVCSDEAALLIAQTHGSTCSGPDLALAGGALHLLLLDAPIGSSDADGDGLPATYSIPYRLVRLDPLVALSDQLGSPTSMVVGFDGDDSYFSQPDPLVCQEGPIASGISQATSIAVSLFVVCLDSHEPSPYLEPGGYFIAGLAAGDAIPVSTSFGTDLDRDGLPSDITRRFGSIAADLSIAYTDVGEAWDPEPDRRAKPLTVQLADIDDDSIPDLTERYICVVL